jgi:hypothetical protein
VPWLISICVLPCGVSQPSKDDVNTAIRGVYVLMRMGLWTPLAAETRNFVKVRRPLSDRWASVAKLAWYARMLGSRG